jgi:hypothetical protein
MVNSVLTWIRRYERHLSTVVFVFGFIGDLLTFTLLDLPLANLLFAFYLALAAVCTFLAHTVYSRFSETDALWRRILSTIAPLAAQYAIGSLLSGFLIFYTKSASIAVSWPFLLLLALIFLGNEVFRDYRAHLAFQTVLFFFALYAYTIFALPLALGHLGKVVFLESTGISMAVFAAFLGLLAAVGWKRLKETLGLILLGVVCVIVFLVTCYFTSLIPPIPLTLRDSGVFHDLQRSADGYTVSTEAARPWWQFYEPQTIHLVPGDPLFAYSAVFAPGDFSAHVIHRWEWYDVAAKKWIMQSKVDFNLSGGRAGGYRGYSEITNAPTGQWRVSIETTSGQTIGRINFNVVEASSEPALHTETR